MPVTMNRLSALVAVYLTVYGSKNVWPMSSVSDESAEPLSTCHVHVLVNDGDAVFTTLSVSHVMFAEAGSVRCCFESLSVSTAVFMIVRVAPHAAVVVYGTATPLVAAAGRPGSRSSSRLA